jgi:hypothetical protein
MKGAHGRLILLCTLIAYIFVLPIAQMAGADKSVIIPAFILVVGAAINAARDRPYWTVIAAIIGAATIVTWMLRLVLDATYLDVAGSSLGFCILLFTIYVVLRRIIVEKAVDTDILCGAVAVYILLGIAWAISFEIFVGLDPDAIAGLSGNAIERSNQLLYFSFTTLTTLGYGDILPVNPLLRMWAILESVSGVIYLAVLIARFVSSYRGLQK